MSYGIENDRLWSLQPEVLKDTQDAWREFSIQYITIY